MSTEADRQPVTTARGIATVHMEWVYWARHSLGGGFLAQLRAQWKVLEEVSAALLRDGYPEEARLFADAAWILGERWYRIVRSSKR